MQENSGKDDGWMDAALKTALKIFTYYFIFILQRHEGYLCSMLGIYMTYFQRPKLFISLYILSTKTLLNYVFIVRYV